MEELRLGKALRELYNQAAQAQDRVIMLYLFGVKHGKMIVEKQLSLSYILFYAQLPESYRSEIEKGIKLGQYVKAIER